MPPEAMIAPGDASTTRRSSSRSGPPSPPSRAIAVTASQPTPTFASASNAISRRETGRAGQPAAADGETVADIERGHDPVRTVALDETTEHRLVVDGRGAEHDPGGTGGEHRPHALLGPQSPADLAGHPAGHGGDDRLDGGRLPLATARRVEVDEMKPASAGRSESLGDRDGVRAVVGLSREVSLAQADDVPAAEVDRRDHRECHWLTPLVLAC